MKRVLLIGLIVGQCYAITTLTGVLKTPDGNGATGVLTLALSQQAALLSSGGCGGPVEVVPNYQVRIQVTNGAMAGTPQVYGNDCMLPNGLYYNAQFVDSGGNVLITDRWVITGSTVDIGTIVSAVVSGTTQTLGAPGIVMTLPTMNQTVTQPLSTTLSVNNLTVPVSLTLPNGSVCTVGGCTGGGLFGGVNPVTVDTAQSITGSKTFVGPTGTILSQNANLGSLANPFVYEWLSGGLNTGPVLIGLWAGVGSITDYYVLQTPSLHTFQILDSDADIVAQYTNTGPPTWQVHGSFSTSDLIGSGSSLGTASTPWWGAWIQGPVTMASDGDPSHQLLVNINAQMVNGFRVIGNAGGPSSGPYNAVDITGGDLYIPSVNTSDLSCTTSNRGHFAFREDTLELQYCNAAGTTLYKVTMGP